jgi:Leucine-rich repeat (LRR) protein
MSVITPQQLALLKTDATVEIRIGKSHLKRSEAAACIDEIATAQPLAEHLSIVSSKLKELPVNISKLRLKKLVLSENLLEMLPPLGDLAPALASLAVNANRLELLPDSLLQLPLRSLDLVSGIVG